jgi:outer membrane immunogenic protein
MRVLPAAALAILMSSSAFAADLTYEPAPVVEATAFNWTGIYAGMQAGYGWGDVDYHFNDSGHYNDEAGDSFGHSIDGWLVGGHIGYNYQINNVVLGIEGAISWSDIGKSDVISPYYPESDTWETKVDWFGTVTPRIGYAFDRALVFAKGGLAFGKVANYVQDGSDYVDSSDTRFGWTVGAGLQYALTNNVLLGVEYNYVDLGSYTVNQDNVDFDGGPGGSFTNHDVDTNFSSVSMTLGYKF